MKREGRRVVPKCISIPSLEALLKRDARHLLSGFGGKQAGDPSIA
jgi:hypothetical protein